jgi:hypothetical protein
MALHHQLVASAAIWRNENGESWRRGGVALGVERINGEERKSMAKIMAIS